MDLIEFLNNKFSSPELKDLNLNFYENVPTGHHRDFLYARTQEKSYKLSKMASAYFSFEKDKLTSHLSNQSETLFIDPELGCLVGKDILEFKLDQIAINYNYSWSDFLKDYTQIEYHEITFSGERYSIFLTTESFHNGLQILGLKDYKNYLSQLIKNDSLNSLDDLFAKNSKYYLQVKSNDGEYPPISEHLKSLDFKKRLIKELNSCLLQLSEKELCLNLLDNYFKVTPKYRSKRLNQLATQPLSPYGFDEEAIALDLFHKSKTDLSFAAYLYSIILNIHA